MRKMMKLVLKKSNGHRDFDRHIVFQDEADHEKNNASNFILMLKQSFNISPTLWLSSLYFWKKEVTLMIAGYFTFTYFTSYITTLTLTQKIKYQEAISICHLLRTMSPILVSHT